MQLYQQHTILKVFLGLILGWILSATSALALEQILLFDSDIQVAVDGQMTVVETIDVQAEGYFIKRGIYRDFPTRYRNHLAIERRTGFKVISVTMNGEPVPSFKQDMMNGERLYIGDKSKFISEGLHRFQLTYQTDYQLQYFDDHDELYWNVTGNGWSFPIQHVTASVQLPKGGQQAIKEVAAWTGYQGEQGKKYTINRNIEGKPNTLHFETTDALSKYQGLTLGISFQKGLFTSPGFEVGRFIQNNVFWLMTLLSLLGLVFFMLLAWYRHGRDPQKGIIIARFKPPAGLSPAAINYLDNKAITNTTLTSALLSLAVKGRMLIKQKSKHYKLIKQTNQTSLSPGEKLVHKKLFDGNNKTLTINTKPNKRLAAAKKLLATKLKKEHKEACFRNNRRYIIMGWLVSLVCCLMFYTLYYGHWVTGGDILAGFFAFLIVFVMAVVLLMTWPLIVGLFMVLMLWGSFAEILGWFSAVQVAVYFTLAMIGLNIGFTWLMQSPTIFGRKIQDKIDGLKLYLTMAEEQRLNLMNPPDKNLAHYEALLPYAVALGLENRWAEKFSQLFVAQQESPDTVKTELPLSWYQGDVLDAGSISDRLVDITVQLDSRVKSAADVPSSKQSIMSSSHGSSYSSGSYSSSSSSSFSSGGGYSGGGGGGGGGGGW